MASIDYNHDLNLHTISGARSALELLFGQQMPKSVLDVGCGRGTWVRAALDLGVPTAYGIDGVAIAKEDLLFRHEYFKCQDLSKSWDLGRRFDIVICLEVAEHLSPSASSVLIKSLIKHSDVIYFAAAAPGQMGQHHVNCQWPGYWQKIFNKHGYACDDWPRKKIWNMDSIEPWYRQNLFVAQHMPALAGKEEMLRPIIHPEMLNINALDLFQNHIAQIETGLCPISWYLSLLPKAAVGKFKRKFIKPYQARTRI